MENTKVKAWDKKSKKMRKVDSIAFDDNGNIKLVNLWGKDIIEDKEIIVRREKQYELLQYTGLKDKNGKEIYEGDIIQFTWDSDSCWGEAGTYKGYVRFREGVFEVVYINRPEITTYDDGTWHENSKSDDIQSLFSWSEDIEIIGDIYENSELLGGIKRDNSI